MSINDFNNIGELLASTLYNDNVIIDYLLEYNYGEYHSLDNFVKKEVSSLFKDWSFTYKYIFTLAILQKLMEGGFPVEKIIKRITEEYSDFVKKETKSFEKVLFYLREVLPSDLIKDFCSKYYNTDDEIIRWDWPISDIRKLKSDINDLREENVKLHKQNADKKRGYKELQRLLEKEKKKTGQLEQQLKECEDLVKASKTTETPESTSTNDTPIKNTHLEKEMTMNARESSSDSWSEKALDDFIGSWAEYP